MQVLEDRTQYDKLDVSISSNGDILHATSFHQSIGTGSAFDNASICVVATVVSSTSPVDQYW